VAHFSEERLCIAKSNSRHAIFGLARTRTREAPSDIKLNRITGMLRTAVGWCRPQAKYSGELFEPITGRGLWPGEGDDCWHPSAVLEAYLAACKFPDEMSSNWFRLITRQGFR
jgi:hypothetical protein